MGLVLIVIDNYLNVNFNCLFSLQNVIERFPASLIQEPTAFTSNGPMEMYNNVLVLIVGGGANSRSEMHIFQVKCIKKQINSKC